MTTTRFQSIAAGLLGRSAFTGGPATVVLGLLPASGVLVSLMPASWNHIADWLQQIDAVRCAA